MTYPSGAGTITGNSGPVAPHGATHGQGTPFPTPGASVNVLQTVPGAPDYNYAETETSTEEILSELAITGKRSEARGDDDKVLYTVPTSNLKNVAQTNPAAPTGTFAQSGSAYITNTSSVVLAGIAVKDFCYYAGITGRLIL